MTEKNTKSSSEQIALIEMSKIKQPKQAVRTSADEDKLKELIRSIKQYGLIHPIVVYKKGKNYEIFAGHRRYLACKTLKMKKVPCYIRSASETDRDFMKLQENTVREDVNAVDQGRYIKYMIDKYGFSHQKIAEQLGLARPTVSNLVRLTTYPDYIQEAIIQGKMGAHIAHILVQIDDPQVLKMYVGYAVADGLSQKTAVEWVQNFYAQKEEETKRVAPSSEPVEEEPRKVKLPGCYFCGKTSDEVPLEYLTVCTRCRVDIEDILKAQMDKKT